MQVDPSGERVLAFLGHALAGPAPVLDDRGDLVAVAKSEPVSQATHPPLLSVPGRVDRRVWFGLVDRGLDDLQTFDLKGLLHRSHDDPAVLVDNLLGPLGQVFDRNLPDHHAPWRSKVCWRLLL